MKLKFLFYLLVPLFIGCSSDDDCDAKKKSIKEHYEAMIAVAEANYAQHGGSHEQIDLLRQEYQVKLQNACK